MEKLSFYGWLVPVLALLVSCGNLLTPQDPGVPTRLVASHSSSTTAIELSWKSAASASSYRVYRADGSDSAATYQKLGDVKGCAYSDAQTLADRNYWYKVSALNSAGKESSPSALAYGSRRGVGGAVANPYDVTATKGGWGSITISWKVDAPVTRSIIYYGRKADGSDMVEFDEINGTSYRWGEDILWPAYAGSVAGVNLYFWVKSVSPTDSAVTSALSLPDSGYSFGGEASKPEGLVASMGTARQVSLSWKPVLNASRYLVQRSEYIGGPAHFTKEVRSGTSTSDEPPVLGKRYFYSVCAQATTSHPRWQTISSSPSEAAMGSAQILDTLAPPAGLCATRKSRYAVSLSWSVVAGADGYRVYRSLSRDGIFDLIVPAETQGITGRSFTDFNLTPGTDYFYRVSAYTTKGSTTGTMTGEGGLDGDTRGDHAHDLGYRHPRGPSAPASAPRRPRASPFPGRLRPGVA